MKKMFVILWAVMLIGASATPVFAVTPALNIKVPQISEIKFNIKLDEKLEKAVAEAVKNLDFFKLFGI